jgi:hypothetical protein
MNSEDEREIHLITLNESVPFVSVLTKLTTFFLHFVPWSSFCNNVFELLSKESRLQIVFMACDSAYTKKFMYVCAYV